MARTKMTVRKVVNSQQDAQKRVTVKLTFARMTVPRKAGGRAHHHHDSLEAVSPLTTPPSSPVPGGNFLMEEVLIDSQEAAEHCRVSYTHNHSTLLQPVQKGVPEKYKEAVLEDGVVFCYPGCHKLEDRATGSSGKRVFRPYWGFMTQNQNREQVPILLTNPHIQTHYGMSSHSEVNDDPLAIIHLYLASMDPCGSPPRLVYESFRSYFHPNDLLFFELKFDAGTSTKEANHLSKMASLVERLWCTESAHVLLFITTHSEEVRGNLFMGHCDHGGGPVADEVTKFFKTILCGGITPFLCGGMVVLLTCSWVVQFEGSFMSLQTVLTRLPICNCIAFVMLRFQTPLANIFLLSLFRSRIIQSINFPDSFPHALEQDSELGAHTDIMHFYFDRSSPPNISMTCDKYVWWNANMRPYGHNLPLLCPMCTSIRPWAKIANEGPNSWNMQCSNSDCGLNADGSQLQPRAKLSGEKPANVTFVMPTNKRTNGWFSVRVADVQKPLA
ncbi:hypothetical protein SCLCIDRAFT_12301 [Scleroderma citrinum Foug A]|uniref:Uncharacterized protein n=1 Tax=Scleroderma citrinum Foug A TaxID=1036808 RepID=A0A0C2YLV1_9AGAM|nr:hypothetical protein SCLCIDRAFT_12301 [Scleroderma citrinum Foug A]